MAKLLPGVFVEVVTAGPDHGKLFELIAKNGSWFLLSDGKWYQGDQLVAKAECTSLVMCPGTEVYRELDLKNMVNPGPDAFEEGDIVLRFGVNDVRLALLAVVDYSRKTAYDADGNTIRLEDYGLALSGFRLSGDDFLSPTGKQVLFAENG